MDPDEASRRYRAAITAVVADLRRASQSALVRALPITIAAAFVGGIVAGYFGISDVVAREPLATVAAAGALVVTFAVIVGIVLWRVLGGSRGDVLDVIAWAADEEQREWTAASSGSSAPRSPRQARRWLAEYPETDANQPQRVAAALMVGDLVSARGTLVRYPVGTAFQRHRRAADELCLALVAGRTVTDTEIGAAYAELGPEDRVHAITCRAAAEALAAALSNGDWRGPLARARPGLPAEATNVGRRQAWLLLLATNVAIFALTLGALAAAWIFILR